MSVCVVIQLKNEIVMASDRAICIPRDNGASERVVGECQKVWYANGKTIFCGGSRDFSEGLKEYTQDWYNDIDIESIVKYAKAHHNYNQGDRDGIIVADIVNGETIVTELISTDDFTPKVNLYNGNNEDNCIIHTLGWRADELRDRVYGELFLADRTNEKGKRLNVGSVLKNAFNSVICAEIGVSLDIYKLTLDKEKEEWYKENNKTRPSQFQQVCPLDCSDINIPLEDNIEPSILLIDTKKEHLFLGTELDLDGERRAKLRLTGKDGEYALTEEGCVLKDQIVFADNVSKGFPIIIPYRVDQGVHSIKQAILTLYLSKYRTFERGMSSAPSTSSGASSITTSGASSNTTSGSGGDHRHLVLRYEPQGLITRNASPFELGGSQGGLGNTVYLTTDVREDIYTLGSSGTHKHDMSHNHSMSHNHTINGHNHELEYGIYENSLPSDVSVYVNGVLVDDNININSEVDITQYVKTNTVNEIKIYSQTNGRISANIWASMFNYW